MGDIVRAAVKVVAVSVVLVVGLATSATAATDGSPRTTFGSNGQVTDNSDALTSSYFSSVVELPNGKLLAGITATNSKYGTIWSLKRYLANGQLDTSFGQDGTANSPGINDVSGLTAFAVQREGKIVGISSPRVIAGAETSYVFRYTAAGALDTSFSSTGYRALTYGTNGFYASAVTIQPDGKIIVVGTSVSANSDQGVARFLPDGTPDTTFDGDGYSNFDWSGKDQATSVALQPDGKILVGGGSLVNGVYGMSLMRLTTSGESDPTFSTDGLATEAIGSNGSMATAVALLPGGKILAAGYENGVNTDAMVARFNADGSLDSTYGDGGHRAIGGSGDDVAAAIALQRDGKAVLVGALGFTTSTPVEFIARVTSAGNLDTSFGPNGYRTPTQPASYSYGSAVVVARNGDIVTGGRIYTNGIDHPNLQRLIGDGAPPSATALSHTPLYVLKPVALHWHATDANTGVHTYSLVIRTATHSQTKLGGWRPFKNNVAATGAALAGTPGTTYCVRARATDYAGNIGGFGNTSCVSFPMDDRGLAAHGRWANGKSASTYRGTYRATTTKGASLTGAVAFHHLALLATTCKQCGVVNVYLGKKLLKTINLRSATTHNQVLIKVAASSKLLHGTIRVVVTSQGKRVQLDGLAVSLL